MKFFNFSKKWRFASSSITKYILAALLSLAGVQGVLAQNPDNTWTLAGSMNDWNASDPNYAFVRQDVSFAGNNYTNYLDLEFPEAGSFEYKLVEAGNNWYGMTTTINNTCKWWEWKSDDGNTTFNYNAGKYRFYINANSDQRRITVTGIFVTIDEEPVNNGDGTYTITGHYTNANPSQQNINTYQIVFSEGVGQGVGANETATVGKDGSFSITKQLVEGQQYTCCARAIDGSIGDHDSKYITFTAEAATPEPEPEPEPVSLYLIGAGTSAQWVLANALPFTYENGVYTWTGELTVNNEAFKILTSNTEWEPAYVAETDQFEVVPGEAIVLHYREKTGDNQYTWGDNKFKITKGGEYTIKVTLGADNSGSMIVTKKSDPAYSVTITADASTSQETAGQVALTSSLTETSASTDLATATCVFQYKAADAGDETYADMSEPASVAYSTEGATRIATLSQSMAAGDYVFRAVWTYNSAEVANAVTETVTIPSDTPTPTDIEFYVRGEKIGCTPSEGGNCWGVASGEFKATYKEGNVYVWDWTEPKLMVGPFKIADANFSDANNYGLDNKTTINLTDGK